MRDIKFRSWSKRNKEMLTPYFFVNGENFITQYGGSKPDAVMQFTGIKDISGVEVYEGDIVKFIDTEDQSNESNGTYSEDFSNIGTIYYSSEFNGWDISGRETDREDAFFEIEVVGNIYENPEMLED